MAKRIERQVAGGWIDDTLSPRASELIQALNDDTLHDAIGQALGEYRVLAAHRDAAPAPADRVKHLEKTGRSITSMIDDMVDMPEDSKVQIAEYMRSFAGEDFAQVSRRLMRDLQLYQAACQDAATRKAPTKRGEKSKHLEMGLLSEVVDLIQSHVPGKQAAAEKAAEILTACGVHHLHGAPKTLADALTKYRRSLKKR